MGKSGFSLRRYDTQARVSVVLAVAAVVSFVGQAYFVFRNINLSEMMVYYGRLRGPIVKSATAMTLLLALAAFGFGINSAGQRRNDKQQLSWIGFFVSAGVFCLAVLVYLFFRTRGESIIQ